MNFSISSRIKRFAIAVFLLAFLAVGGYYFFFLSYFPGRTNIAVLGMSGKGYPGGDLTDTMIFLSADNQTGKVLVLSIPRDIWITPLRTKINSVYHYRGLTETKKTIGQILGQPVDYGVTIDSTLFKNIVDVLGGVEVWVERGFDDTRYPITGKENDLCDGDKEYKCRYETLHFEPGQQWMNGDRALKFVRSRNAQGDEGTDFARSQRQQQLMAAIVNKASSLPFWLNPRHGFDLYQALKSGIKTDISTSRYLDLVRTMARIRTGSIKMEVLNSGYLIKPPAIAKYDKQWVLIPKNGNWDEIHRHVESLLSGW